MGSYFLRHLPSPLSARTQTLIQTKMKLLKFLLPLLLVASVSSFSIKSLFSHEEKSDKLPAEDSAVDEVEEELENEEDDIEEDDEEELDNEEEEDEAVEEIEPVSLESEEEDEEEDELSSLEEADEEDEDEELDEEEVIDVVALEA